MNGDDDDTLLVADAGVSEGTDEAELTDGVDVGEEAGGLEVGPPEPSV